MSPMLERVKPEIEHGEAPRPVAHLSFDWRVALCGARLRGVRATGNYDSCEACWEEWERLREEPW